MTLKMFRPAELGKASAEIANGFTVREMRPGEEADWSYACLNSFDIESVTAEYYEKMMANDKGVRMQDVFFVCKEDKPVGTATARMEEADPFLHFVAVNPDFRGYKLALPVIAAVINRHLEMGRDGCFLWTDDWRVPAVKSYLNLGFLPVLFNEGAREAWEKEIRLFGINRLKAYNADMSPAEDIVAY